LACGFAPDKIYMLACTAFEGTFDSDTIKHWLKTFVRRFFGQQFKRSAMPDGVRVCSVALSPRGAWVMPSDACASTWMSTIEEL
jgi:NAD+ synthase (glutamine-hydrolysing)